MESVNIATLKAKLSHYLKSVRRGATVNVLDHSTPIARIIPYQNDEEALPSRASCRSLKDVVIPTPSGRDFGSLEALLEERTGDR